MKMTHRWLILSAVSLLVLISSGVFAFANTQPSKAIELTLPAVKDMNLETAKTYLSDGDYQIELMYAQSPQTQGTVFKQEPEAGTKVKRGAVIRLYVAIPETKGRSQTSSVPTEEPQVQQPVQQSSQNTNSNQQGNQKTKAQLDAERKATIERLKAEAKAAYEADMKRIADEQARIAAEQARRDALYNAMVAAQSELQSARYALDRAVASVNDFAARGMLQSGAGYQASAARDEAQIRYNNALIAEQAATAAWNAR